MHAMKDFDQLLVRAYLFLTIPPRRDERGDVPGWVLVTVMTAGLATAIYTVAKGRLAALLRAALANFT